MTAAELVTRWRSDAELLEAHGATEAATTCRLHAAAVEAAIAEEAGRELTLQEAVAESGFSERRLRELISEGRIPNAGEKGRPRIRRADLPMKPRASGAGFDAAAEARSILGRAG